jgi:alpha-beta hydrolase superfamily lysophospholipase
MSVIDRRSALRAIGAAAAMGAARSASAGGPGNDKGPHRGARFVLIHGAWQNAKAWNGVAALLRQAGHDVETPTLPGAAPGDNQVGIEFGDYVDAVVDAMHVPSRKAIVVAHSSAGMLMQAAAPRVRHAIELIVFCNAFIMADGQSQLDNVPPDAAAALSALAQQNGGIIPFAPLEGFIRGALMEGDPVSRQNALLQILVDQPISLFATPVDTKAFDALDVPKAVLFCSHDHSADYLGMAARLRHYDTVVAEGSHEMLFSAPQAYTKALLDLVASRC